MNYLSSEQTQGQVATAVSFPEPSLKEYDGNFAIAFDRVVSFIEIHLEFATLASSFRNVSL